MYSNGLMGAEPDVCGTNFAVPHEHVIDSVSPQSNTRTRSWDLHQLRARPGFHGLEPICRIVRGFALCHVDCGCMLTKAQHYRDYPPS